MSAFEGYRSAVLAAAASVVVGRPELLSRD
jgi:hypothetical protein